MIHIKKRVMVYHNTSLNLLRAAKLLFKNTQFGADKKVISSPISGSELE